MSNQVNLGTVTGNLNINSNGIFINGRKIGDYDMKEITVIIEGNVQGNLTVEQGSVECRDVTGDVDAGNGVRCGNVNGDVGAGNSVKCNSIKGKAKAGNSINCSCHS